ncbi:MAG: PC4/YdbC family ssDNA-binding protein [Clostridia bacterium]|nr:PC4/YdbC family ssDNA-binding protein [Clostridia bacterium]
MEEKAVVFEIKEHIGEVATYQTGWKKEINLVCWNNGSTKVDIRDWEPDHEHMSRGITLHMDEARTLVELLNGYFQRVDKEQGNKKEKTEEK